MKRACGAAVLAMLCGCPGGSAPPPPSKPPPPSELAAGRLTLSEQAVQRLGIPDGLRPVELRLVSTHALLAGEVVPVAGRLALLSAPITGVVAGTLPTPGARVRAGEVLCTLTPLLATTERVQVSTAQLDTDAQVARAQVADDAAQLALERAHHLVTNGLAGARVLDEASAARDTTRETLKAAQTKRQSLGAQDAAGLMAPITVRAPWTGVVRDVRVGSGQKVGAGSALVELVQDDPLWVRVSVPSAILGAVMDARGAWVQPLGGSDETWRELPRAREFPPTQVLPGQVDLCFVLTAPHTFRLGQRVAVRLPQTAQKEERKLVPVAAVLHGLSGEVWVYENTGSTVFERRRVEVLGHEGALAVLGRADALPVGAKVVTTGALELFGAEFGVGK